MAATYVHLSGRDVNNALLKLHGMKADEEGKKGSSSLLFVLDVRTRTLQHQSSVVLAVYA